MTLERHVPIEMPNLEALVPHEAVDAIALYFQTMGFGTLLNRLLSSGEPAKVEKAKPKPKPKPKNPQTPLF